MFDCWLQMVPSFWVTVAERGSIDINFPSGPGTAHWKASHDGPQVSDTLVT